MTFDLTELGSRLLTPEQSLATPVYGQHKAAVLVPIYTDGVDYRAVFTKRVTDLRHHAGEISFPGGRPAPRENLIETALRETAEEIGLTGNTVEIVGALKPTSTVVTGYAIYPFVGVMEDISPLRANPTEVERIISVPLKELADSHEPKLLVRQGIEIPTDTYQADGEQIWGATARIVRELLERLNLAEPLARKRS